MAQRHAYMIMAHKYDLTLRTLLQMLDDPRNDIYIHFDGKVRAFDPEKLQDCVKEGEPVPTDELFRQRLQCPPH